MSKYNIVIKILFYSDLNNPEESPIGPSKDSPTTAGKVIKFMFTHSKLITVSHKPNTNHNPERLQNKIPLWTRFYLISKLLYSYFLIHYKHLYSLF